jgi:hypothetical protein
VLWQGCHSRHLKFRRSNPSIIPSALRHRQHYLSVSSWTYSVRCSSILFYLMVFERTVFFSISQIRHSTGILRWFLLSCKSLSSRYIDIFVYSLSLSLLRWRILLPHFADGQIFIIALHLILWYRSFLRNRFMTYKILKINIKVFWLYGTCVLTRTLHARIQQSRVTKRCWQRIVIQD